MEKKSLVLAVLIVVVSLCRAQSALIPAWVKVAASPLGSGQAQGWGVDVDLTGDIYWPVSMDTLSGQGLDIVCFKYDASGNHMWTGPAHFGGNGTQQSYVVNASDTFLYIGGRHCTGLVNTCDMLLVKTDKSTGATVWSRTWDRGFGYDEVDGLVIRPEGIYMGGWASGPNGLYDADMGLWKVYFDGSTDWTNFWGTPNGDHQDGHFVVDDNYIYAAGLVNGTGIANLYEGRSLLAKFDKSNGALIDSTTFGSAGWWLNWDNALGMTSDGTWLYLCGIATPSPNDNQLFIARYDKNLNQNWIQFWGGTGTETGRAIAVRDGIVYIGGSSNSVTHAPHGGYDMVLLRIDTAGNLLSWHNYGDSLDNEIRDLAVSSDAVYLSGSNAFSSNPSKAMLLKIDLAVLSAERPLAAAVTSFHCHPNPYSFATSITYSLSREEETEVLVYNTHGICLFHLRNGRVKSGLHSVEIPVEALGNGMSLVELRAGGQSSFRRIVRSR